MSEDHDKVLTLKVRVSPELKQSILESASANNRSMNAEIVHHIKNGLQKNKDKQNSFLSYDKDSLTLVIKDADERNRLAQIAAKADFDALEQSLDQDDNEKKAP